jgi:hypothetical protein
MFPGKICGEDAIVPRAAPLEIVPVAGHLGNARQTQHAGQLGHGRTMGRTAQPVDTAGDVPLEVCDHLVANTGYGLCALPRGDGSEHRAQSIPVVGKSVQIMDSGVNALKGGRTLHSIDSGDLPPVPDYVRLVLIGGQVSFVGGCLRPDVRAGAAAGLRELLVSSGASGAGSRASGPGYPLT